MDAHTATASQTSSIPMPIPFPTARLGTVHCTTRPYHTLPIAGSASIVHLACICCQSSQTRPYLGERWLLQLLLLSCMPINTTSPRLALPCLAGSNAVVAVQRALSVP